ncbi:MAG TPA: hypothetical protein VGM39_26260 [Kofleriaceae bacterium]|jgi:hypothetical protein
MKLGEMLVRDGRLTEAQLETALKYQARDGGRIGTVLFEHGLIDLEALTVYLGLELGIPIATGAMLERAKRAAVRLLQPQQAFKHKCVPLVVQDRQLIAAIADGHDFATLEALNQITGYRVLPRVAPELRIYYYVERYYGVARPTRYVKFAETPRGDESATDLSLPAPPLPGLPPVPSAPVPAPGPRPRLRSTKMAKMFDDSEALELDADDLIDSLDADDTPAAAPAPAVSPNQARTTTGPTTVAPAAATPAPEVAPLTGDVVMRKLATATDRNTIVESLMGFAAATFDGAVVFTVRDNMAFGWRAIGNIPGHASIEHILLPLDVPSVVQPAMAADTGVSHGPLVPSTANSYLFKVLGVADPAFVAAGVVSIGKRVVNVLYGHSPKELTAIQVGVFQQVCQSAAEAYARLIAAKKK